MDLETRGIVLYPSSENKGDDQLRGYREADLRLCFHICRLLVFSRGGSNTNHVMIKPDLCLRENKGADQLCSNCTVDQSLCFCYRNSTMFHLLIFEISGFQPSSVTLQADLCWTWSETRRSAFSHHGSHIKCSSLMSR